MTKYFISAIVALMLITTPTLAASKKSVSSRIFDRLWARFNRVEEVKPVITTPESPKPVDNSDRASDALSLVSSNPPSGAIYASQPSNPDGSNFWNPKGAPQMIEVTMTGNVASLTPEMFETKGTAADTPRVVSIMPSEKAGTVTLVLNYPIQIGWTTITLKSTGQTINLGYLPGDVDGSGRFNGADWLKLIDGLNGAADLPLYSSDIDASGSFNSADLLRLIDMINGADHFAALDLFGASLPAMPGVETN